VLLAVLLSFVVLLVFQLVFPQPEPGKPGTRTSAAKPTPATSSPAAASAPSAPPASLPPSVQETNVPEREVVVETPEVRAVFTTKAGALKSWRLKKYQDTAGQPLE